MDESHAAAAMASLTRRQRSGAAAKAMAHHLVGDVNAIADELDRDVLASERGSGEAGERALSGSIALKRWVTVVARRQIPRRFVGVGCAVTERDDDATSTQCSISSSAPGSSGAIVIMATSSRSSS